MSRFTMGNTPSKVGTIKTSLDFEDDVEFVAGRDAFEDDLDFIADEAWVREATGGTGGYRKGVSSTAGDSEKVVVGAARSDAAGGSKDESAGAVISDITGNYKNASPTLEETEAVTAQLQHLVDNLSVSQPPSSPEVTRNGQGLSFTCYSSPELSAVEHDSVDRVMGLVLNGGKKGSSQQAAKNRESSGSASDPKNASTDFPKLRGAQRPKGIAGPAEFNSTGNTKTPHIPRVESVNREGNSIPAPVRQVATEAMKSQQSPKETAGAGKSSSQQAAKNAQSSTKASEAKRRNKRGRK
ncbi:hypothetical protein M7I_3812 [Glarea lozoyensis 74030]|uniref:Uncharacterized protein n=1 Tax=Glarea lozoyensis (strain ATCC 74030 / MF5533) TaxID=1104152 RepID=H0EMH5_GLAL7|nr:hypothetical protein M7I_3812 [Glarea lozoyensis 74030]